MAYLKNTVCTLLYYGTLKKVKWKKVKKDFILFFIKSTPDVVVSAANLHNAFLQGGFQPLNLFINKTDCLLLCLKD